MFKTIIARLFARSLQSAHQQWQQLPAKREAYREQIKRKLDDTRMAAQIAGVATPENIGLLRQAYQRLAKPLSRQLLNVHVTIANLFAVHGTSRWRRAPATLLEQLKEYEDLIEAEFQTWQGLLRRLELVRKVLADCQQHPEYAEGLSPRYILEYPEYAGALLGLEQVRYHNRQLYLRRLAKCFAQRLNLAQSWLQLFRNDMSSYQYRLEKRGLDTLASRVSGPEVPDLHQWLHLHTQLDKPLLRLNNLGITSLKDV